MVLWFFVASNIFFASVAVYFSWRYERKSEEVDVQKKDIDRQLFELSLLQSITDKIGYSLNIEAVCETISRTIEKIFNLSTVSYAIREPSKIRIKTIMKEPVSQSYLSRISELMRQAMEGHDADISNLKIEESTSSPDANSYTPTPLDIDDASLPQSYFNVPIVIKGQVVGLINISSKTNIPYKEEDTALLIKIVKTAQDAVERLSDVIRTEESKLDSLILSLPVGTIMFTVDEDHFKLSVINQAARNFLHIGEGNGDVNEVLSRFGQEFKIGDMVQQVFTSEKGALIEDAKIYDHDFLVAINPIFIPGKGTLIGVALIMRDITPEKKLEKIRADFTDMMMHELRAPLTAIRGAATLMTTPSMPEEEKAKMPRIVLNSANDMLSTVSDFLDAAKIDEGKFKLNKVKGDLSHVIAEHVDVFSYAAREKHIALNFDRNAQVAQFYFDPIRVGQVINNLISNSIKFTNENGQIDVRIEQKDGEIEVIVTDNGIGIPDAKKAVLFTKFGQVDGNIEKMHEQRAASGSSGLGLFISKQIVDAHGGRIWLESTENVGTVAHFTLPLTTEEQAEESLHASMSN